MIVTPAFAGIVKLSMKRGINMIHITDDAALIKWLDETMLDSDDYNVRTQCNDAIKVVTNMVEEIETSEERADGYETERDRAIDEGEDLQRELSEAQEEIAELKERIEELENE